MRRQRQASDIEDDSNARLERGEELESTYGEAEGRQAEVAKTAERLAGSLEFCSFVLIALDAVTG